MTASSRPPPSSPAPGVKGLPSAHPPGRSTEIPWEAPTFPFLIASLGGWLILVEGMLLLGGTTFEFAIPLPPSETTQFGGVGITLGLGIVATGFLLNETTGHRRGTGAVLLGLGAASIVSGGGFLLGLGLVVAGGLIALLGKPTPLYHEGHYVRKGNRPAGDDHGASAPKRPPETAPRRGPPPPPSR